MKANQTSELPTQIPSEGKPTPSARRAFSGPNLSIGWFRSFAASFALLLASTYGGLASSASAQMMDISVNPTTGLINGTPTAEGTATITATYTGPGGELCTGTATLSIVNNCCPQLIFAVP